MSLATNQRKPMEKFLEPIELDDAELEVVAGGGSVTLTGGSEFETNGVTAIANDNSLNNTG
jgi:hypothetical protein